LCSGKSEALARLTTESLPAKLLFREYFTALSDEKTLAAELEKPPSQTEESLL